MRRWLLAGVSALAIMAATPAAADPVSIGVAVVGGVVTSAAGTAAATGAGLAGFIGALTSTTALVSGLIGGVGAAAQGLLAGSQSLPAQTQRQLVTTQDVAVARRVIYGRSRVGPDQPFIATTEKDRRLHLVHVLAHHECDALEEIWFDDDLVWSESGGWQTSPKGSDPWSDYVSFTFHAGADGQQADPVLVADVGDWTAAHRGEGVAWVYLRLWGEIKAFKRGLPRITYTVRGRKVYDPRSGTTAWSDNPALCINDWVLYNRFGYREDPKFWDEAVSVATAANICDEQVALAAGGTEPRYRVAAAIRSDLDKEDVLRGLLTSCMGIVPREGPRRRLIAAAYRTPTVELTDDDLAGGVDLTIGKPQRQTYAAVGGRFQSPQANYLQDDYPAVISAGHDPASGDPKTLTLDQPFTPSATQAQRIAKLTLLQQEQRITGQAAWKLKALRLRAGDTFMWTSTRYGWTQKVFEVVERALVVEGDPPTMVVGLTVRETSAAVYDWSSSEETPYLAGTPTNLPDPFDIDAPGVAVYDTLRVFNQQVMTVLVAAPTSSSGNAAGFEVEGRRVGDPDAITMGRGETGNYELPFVEDGVNYEVRARAVTHVGSFSDWFGWVTHQVVGKTALPSDVTGLSVQIVGAEAHLDWTPVSDLDLSHYEVRHSPSVAGPAWGSAQTVVAKVARPASGVTAPALAGTYLVKAVDKAGRNSANAASIVSPVAGLEGLNVVETRTEDPAFTGAKTNTAVVNNGLQLNTTKKFTELGPGNFTTLGPGTFTELGTPYADLGFYEFAQAVDLGAVYTSRITAALQFGVSTPADLKFTELVGLFTELEGVFTTLGQVGTISDVNAALEMSLTDDDPAGTAIWSAWKPFVTGDYAARGFRFRARLTSDEPNSTPRVTALSVTVDMPDRVEAADDLQTGTGGLAITFAPAFKVLTGVAPVLLNAAQGDYIEVTGKSAAGFTLTARDSGGTGVDRKAGYVAKGYGKVTALPATVTVSPDSFPNLAAWWDASDQSSITDSAGSVAQIDDLSGNARHLTQATQANQPLTGSATVNGLNALVFDGVDDTLSRLSGDGGFPLAESVTFVYVVVGDDADNFNDRIIEIGLGTNGTRLRFQAQFATGGVRGLISLAPHTNLGPPADAKQSVPVLFTYRANWSTGVADLRRNGSLVTSVSDYNTTAYDVDHDISLFGGGQFLAGKFCEQAWYHRALADTEIAALEAELISKWAIT